MPEHPGLDYLVWLSVHCGHYTYRMLYRPLPAWMLNKLHKEIYGFLLPAVSLFLSKPPRPTHSSIRAIREGYNHVPCISQNIKYIVLNVPVGVALSRQQITGISLMPSLTEGFSYHLAELTRY